MIHGICFDGSDGILAGSLRAEKWRFPKTGAESGEYCCSRFNGEFHSLETFQTYIKGFGMTGPFILTAVQAFQVVVPVLPGFFGCIVGALLLGSKSRIKQSSGRILALGFAIVITAGALLLSLPLSHQPGVEVPVVDALFTAASATCVTGLVTVDIAETYSVFGQAVVALLIQIGGLGWPVWEYG